MNRPEGAPLRAAALRLDKWLWFARIVRTRSLAARWCAAGQVSVGGGVALKPHHPVRIGDRISVASGRWRREVTVVALGERRGPAVTARLLYDEPAPPLPLCDPDSADWQPLLDGEDGADAP